MCAMKYYEPSDKNQYKELRKNWKKEMKRPKQEFQNHLREYETENHKTTNAPAQSIPNSHTIDHEKEWKNKYEETVTYQIVRKKQAEFTPKGKKRMIWRNINKFLAIFLTGVAIYIWLPKIIYWLQ